MQLNHKVLGAGEPIFILHGLFGMLDNWMTLAKELASSYQVILVDQRNHGKSLHDSDISYRSMADDLRALMDELEISTGHVLGHSMGGKTAMTFADQYHDRCRSLIVVDIAPKIYAASHIDIFEAILNLNLDLYSRRGEVDMALSKSIKVGAVRQFLLKNLKRTTDGFGWKANFQSLYKGYDELLAIDPLNKSLVPALFIRGTKSNYISATDEMMIKDIYENVDIADINAGHWIHAEKPMELIEVLTTHLTSN